MILQVKSSIEDSGDLEELWKEASGNNNNLFLHLGSDYMCIPSVHDRLSSFTFVFVMCVILNEKFFKA